MSDLIDRTEAISRAVELRMYGKPVKMVAVSELERLEGVQACEDVISRQAAIEALIKWYGCEPTDIGSFENIIEKLPSAQPEIIRCKDCKHYMYPHGCGHIDGMTTAQEDGYCSYAERREE